MADVAARDGGQAPGALHHIIVRGIEKRKIFKDHADRQSFIERPGDILSDSQTPRCAWALMPSHLHLLREASPNSQSPQSVMLLGGA